MTNGASLGPLIIRPHSKNRRPAFTIVELLVVAAILGVLVALLLPAIQAAREASRRTQCKSNIRQLGLAAQAHVSALRHFPTGGWGGAWIGDPDRGAGPAQPGGWIYNLLPYMEEAALHDRGRGLSTIAKRQAAGEIMATPLFALNCPSRRQAVLYPHSPPYLMANAGNVSAAARTDYAFNAGDRSTNEWDSKGGPAGFEAASTTYLWPEPQRYTGLSYIRSQISVRRVTDGLSKTYLIGEKYAKPRDYETGNDAGDYGSMYSGFWSNQYRLTLRNAQPIQDTDKVADRIRFGSAHAAGLHMAFADGSVQLIDYEIEAEVHGRFGNREDGFAVPGIP